MIRFSVSVIIFSASFLVVSCGEEEGACEMKFPSATGGASYSCLNAVSPELCGNIATEVVYHAGASCPSLGYTVASDASFEGRYTVEANDLSKPGPNGAFKDDVPVNNQGSLCDNEYDGPLFDTQIDSQCQAAYIYTCEDFQQGIDASCDIYRSFQANDPNIPDCPYCG